MRGMNSHHDGVASVPESKKWVEAQWINPANNRKTNEKSSSIGSYFASLGAKRFTSILC
jgi:hypothetical protein